MTLAPCILRMKKCTVTVTPGVTGITPIFSLRLPLDLVLHDEGELTRREGRRVVHGPSSLERDILIFPGSADVSDRPAFRTGIGGEQFVAVGVGLGAPAVELVGTDASFAILETTRRHIVEQLGVAGVLGDPDALRHGLGSGLAHIDGVELMAGEKAAVSGRAARRKRRAIGWNRRAHAGNHGREKKRLGCMRNHVSAPASCISLGPTL